MSFRSLSIVLVAILVLGETGLALWRNLPIPVSTAPVFSFPPAAANFGKPGNLAPAIALYGADRGAEWNHTAPDGSRLTVFYFEWDQVAVGPVMSMAGHSPDECNVAAGFTLKGILSPFILLRLQRSRATAVSSLPPRTPMATSPSSPGRRDE